MLRTCVSAATAVGCRDAAIIALVYGVGLQNREICRLSRGDWNEQTHSLRVPGPGGMFRMTKVPTGVAAVLNGWLHARGDDLGPLVCSFRRCDKLVLKPISDSLVTGVILKVANAAGIPARTHTPERGSLRAQEIEYPMPHVAAAGPRGAVTAYLERLNAKERIGAMAALKLLLEAIGAESITIFSHQWARIPLSQLREALRALPVPPAMLTKIRKAYGGVLRECLKRGEISCRDYEELTGWSWRDSRS